MNNINALKQEISAELSRLLDTLLTPYPLSTDVEKGKINNSLVSTLVEKREGVMRKRGEDDIIAKMTQLYYLNLLQIENIKSLSSADKEKVKQDILKDYKKNLMRVIYLTQYAGSK